MSSKSSRKKVKPKMLIKETLYKTKRFFHETYINLKSFISRGYQKLPKTPTASPTFSCSNDANSKLQELDNFYRSFTEHWDSIEKVKKKKGHLSPKVQAKGDEQRSKSWMSAADCRGSEDLRENNKESKCSGRKQEKSSLLAAHALAQKMKEVEMMDARDMDHVLDIEEVLHYYSRLTCPAYVEIVDKFFMDMYSEFSAPQSSRSVHSAMRHLGSKSGHSSMRSLGPVKLYTAEVRHSFDVPMNP